MDRKMISPTIIFNLYDNGTNYGWNNHINSCIDSYLHSQICIDSSILSGCDNSNDNYIYNYIYGEGGNSIEVYGEKYGIEYFFFSLSPEMVKIKHNNHEGSNYYGGGSRKGCGGDQKGDGAKPNNRGPLDNEVAEKQFDHLKWGRSLMLGSLITIRNIFRFFLENHSLNGYRSTDTVADPQMGKGGASYKVMARVPIEIERVASSPKFK
ncbi:hypothetical protein PVK06_001430 [Gossypium arboreum]|uniref:Uncharacterized protein n=1 Tax=Gossypium arboreum TaxID=29729 RepID=A0ABR0R134_GOSAR|nr:hypothetical protein PVK06_001430 [Gossypium arboreum]